MALQLINTGSIPNDGTGDTLQQAFRKLNENLTYIETVINTYAPTVGYGYELPNPPTVDIFFVLTAEDTTPVAFSFAPVAASELSTQHTSDVATITGISGPAAVSITGGEWSKSADGTVWSDFTASSGTILNGYRIKVRSTSSSSYLGTTTVALTIGTVTSDFVISTKTLADSFTGATNSLPNGAVWDHVSGVTGADTISAGSYSEIQTNKLLMHLNGSLNNGTDYVVLGEVLKNSIVRHDGQSISIDFDSMNLTYGNMKIILSPVKPTALPLGNSTEMIQLLASTTNLLFRHFHSGTMTTPYNATLFSGGDSTKTLKLVLVDATHVGVYVNNVEVSGSPFVIPVDITNYFLTIQATSYGNGFVDYIFDNLAVV